jgi:4-amino-4-deoxychorismate lyase
VIITRGEGGRGYSPEGAINPKFIITLHPIPPHYSAWQAEGIKLTVSPITLACQPLLAGIKHLNRLEQVLVKQALAQTTYDDAVVCDTNQNIVETSVGNLFWYQNNIWYSADLTDSGVAGVMRSKVLTVMQQKAIKCQLVKQNINALFSAQELFVCNSLMTLVPVVSLFDPISQQHKRFTTKQIKKLQHSVQHIIHLEALKV